MAEELGSLAVKIEQGWTLNDIDEMDIFYYFDILIYRANKEYRKNLNAVLNIL